MTGPSPDAELDAALGVTELPPATVTDAHRALARELRAMNAPDAIAQAIADAEARGAARVIAEHRTAGT